MTDQTTVPTLTPKMKLLKAIPTFITWLCYWFITQKERQEYLMAKSHGFDCVDSFSTLGRTTFLYNQAKKPTRRYVTWKEYWYSKGYYSNTILTNNNNS